MNKIHKYQKSKKRPQDHSKNSTMHINNSGMIDKDDTQNIEISALLRNLQYVTKSKNNNQKLSQTFESQHSLNSFIKKEQYSQSKLSHKLTLNTTSYSKDGFRQSSEQKFMSHPLSGGPRIKLIKRYQQKSKTSNVLMKIGYAQKKYKLKEETKELQKGIGIKLDEDRNNFFELLDQTTQNFFQSLEKSNDNSLQNTQVNLQINSEYNSQPYIPLKEQRPITQARNRASLLNQPAFLQRKENHQYQNTGRSQRTTQLLDFKRMKSSYYQQSNVSKEFGSTCYQSDTQKNFKLQKKQNIVDITSRNEPSFDSKLTQDTTKMTIQGENRPKTSQFNHIIGRKIMIQSFIKQKIPQSFDKTLNISNTQNYLSNQTYQDKNSFQNEVNEDQLTKMLEDRYAIQEKASEKEGSSKNSFCKNSRVSFKKQRELDLQQQQQELLENEILSLFPVEAQEALKNLSYLACNVINVCQNNDSFETKKLQIVEIWNQIIEQISTNAELNSFEIVFLATKMLGDFYIDLKDLSQAVRIYKGLKRKCEIYQKYKEKMVLYEQICYTNRLMQNYDDAVKASKKQLQLAWEQKNIQMEVCAYDNLSIDYFYLGLIDKSQYYQERMMRGKTENEKSIVKRVSTNYLKQRMQLKHNPENDSRVSKEESQKAKLEFNRLPSPSCISKGAQFSKAINLLPHYTEAESMGQDINQQESQDKRKQKQQRTQSLGINKGANFKMPELKYLNKTPHYDYLRINKQDNILQTFFNILTLSRKHRTKSFGENKNKYREVYRQDRGGNYKMFNEKKFRAIVEYAVQKKENSSTCNDQRRLTHLSVHRTAPLNQIIPQKLFQGIERQVQDFSERFMLLVAQKFEISQF